MKVKEIKDYLRNMPNDASVIFTDVCGNWFFDIYNLELDDNGKVYIIGDETYMEE